MHFIVRAICVLALSHVLLEVKPLLYEATITGISDGDYSGVASPDKLLVHSSFCPIRMKLLREIAFKAFQLLRNLIVN